MTLGQKLSEQRRKLKKSLKEVETDLRIRVKYLEALENDDFKQIPGEAYIKAILRSYSAYLGLDFEKLLNEYLSLFSQGEEELSSANESILKRKAIRVLVLIMAVAIIFLAIWLAIPEKKPTPEFPASPIKEKANSSDAYTTPSVPLNESTTPPSKEREFRPFKLEILVSGKGRCWVEIKANDSVFLARTLSTGEKVEFTVTETARLLLGNPSVVTVYINGKVLAEIPKYGVVETTVSAKGIEQ